MAYQRFVDTAKGKNTVLTVSLIVVSLSAFRGVELRRNHKNEDLLVSESFKSGDAFTKCNYFTKFKRHSKVDKVNTKRCGGSGDFYNYIASKYPS